MVGTDRSAGDGSAGARSAADVESEVVVGLTDLVVGAVAVVLTASNWTARPPSGPGGRRARELRRGFSTFFGTVAIASIAGAALHGLFRSPADPGRRALWRLSLGAIGTSAAAGTDIAAALAMPPRLAARARTVALTVVVAWHGILALSLPPYRAVIALTVPSIAVLAGALASRLGDARERAAALLGLGGLALTVAAAAVQVSGIGLGRRFGPNALYHTVQAVALVVLGRSAAAFRRAAGGG